MTFDPTIPQPTDRPSASQAQLLNNFTQLNTVFSVDHVAFNATTDRGEHNQITLNSTVADPGLGDPKCSLYIKTVAGDSELFFEKYDNTAVANLVQQMTNLTITTAANAGTAGGNISYIDTPWGLRFLWGLTGAISGAFTVIAPAGTLAILSYQLTGNVSTGTRNPINGGTVAGTTMTIRTIDNVSVQYFMIGTY
jgi:hypothetical protein